ncbi:MAG TPA: hypothetical protein VJG13_03430 [Thermoanaerobaculia bacterium]|nr:hypothetical protein [Thermoanaerobaculia bacterium]
MAGEHPEVVAELSATLARWREWVEERKLAAESTDALSAAELERLRSLGYI